MLELLGNISVEHIKKKKQRAFFMKTPSGMGRFNFHGGRSFQKLPNYSSNFLQLVLRFNNLVGTNVCDSKKIEISAEN